MAMLGLFCLSVVFALCVLVLNSLSIAAIIRTRGVRTSHSNMFLLNLAVIDILMMVPELYFAISMLRGYIKLETLMVTGTLFATLSAAALLNNFAIAVDRFLFIQKAMTYPVIVTSSRVRLVVIIIWSLSLLAGTIPLYDGQLRIKFQGHFDDKTCELITKNTSDAVNHSVEAYVSKMRFFERANVLYNDNISSSRDNNNSNNYEVYTRNYSTLSSSATPIPTHPTDPPEEYVLEDATDPLEVFHTLSACPRLAGIAEKAQSMILCVMFLILGIVTEGLYAKVFLVIRKHNVNLDTDRHCHRGGASSHVGEDENSVSISQHYSINTAHNAANGHGAHRKNRFNARKEEGTCSTYLPAQKPICYIGGSPRYEKKISISVNLSASTPNIAKSSKDNKVDSSTTSTQLPSGRSGLYVKRMKKQKSMSSMGLAKNRSDSRISDRAGNINTSKPFRKIETVHELELTSLTTRTAQSSAALSREHRAKQCSSQQMIQHTLAGSEKDLTRSNSNLTLGPESLWKKKVRTSFSRRLRDMRTIKMLMTMYVIYYFCWAPMFACRFTLHILGHPISDNIHFASWILGTSNSVWNFFVYEMRNRKLRTAIRDIVCTCFQRKCKAQSR